jgi:hypothetical protein
MRKRRVSQIITSALDKDGVTKKTFRDSLHKFVYEFQRNKYDHFQMDDACVNRMGNPGHKTFRWDGGTSWKLPKLKRN